MTTDPTPYGMDIHAVMRQIPHRYPFLLVDRVLELVPGKTIKALKNVTANEPYFPGHFPHRPVMPGVIILEALAQAVLDARAEYLPPQGECTLADLYDPLTMPPELLKAHQKLDAAVDKAYEASGGKKSYKSDAERVAFLFELYQKLTSLLPTEKSKPKRHKAI